LHLALGDGESLEALQGGEVQETLTTQLDEGGLVRRSLGFRPGAEVIEEGALELTKGCDLVILRSLLAGKASREVMQSTDD